MKNTWSRCKQYQPASGLDGAAVRAAGAWIALGLLFPGGHRADAAPPWDCGATPGGIPQLKLDQKSAAPVMLQLGGREIPLVRGAGGFVIHDYNAQKEVPLDRGTVHEEGGTLKYDPETDGQIKEGAVLHYRGEGNDLILRATFTPKDGCVEVRGEIENRRGDDRAVIVRYILPVPARGAMFEDELSHAEVVRDRTNGLGTVFPLAAMTGQDWGAALAIPPTAPCCFGMTGSTRGLGVEFYLGISPKPRAFPNKAPFSFLIYSAIPGWGFRSAVAQYERRYSAYYDETIRGGGAYLWAQKGEVDYALPLFRMQGIPGHQSKGFDLWVDRARKGHLLTVEYIGSTTRDVKLETEPADYAAAMAAFAAYKAGWNAMTEEERQRKFPQFRYRDEMNAIEHGVITDADGKNIIVIRGAPDGRTAIAFTMNPNPALFQDRGWTTVGSSMVKAAQEYLRTDPIDGTTVDSLGANFPAHLNFRQDHFPDEKFPLTFDRKGRIAIHNMISHYELMEVLRELDHHAGKISSANGIYRYSRDLRREENYNGMENGRFFIAALLDRATRECSKLLPREQFEFGRVALGRKLYHTALHGWSNAEEVRMQLNRALPYTDFAMPGGGRPYLTAKDGYFRDQEVLEWFTKYARLLSDAGWQPMTRATVDHPGEVACERYGSGGDSYFALVNFGEQPLNTEVSIDLHGLDVTEKNSKIIEIARGAQLTQTADAEVCRVQIKLDPSVACILKLVREKR